ncbi:hypothetical protein [Oceanicola sp. 22II-s10i]|uniref:hypothetical protein n=1 Tax=Oceanicola sp. 22II-s10i TaxID=1317116 RepID=UPI0011305480|nr:hypothetical protein [Oceanicola sp. 22II-s10i]
MTHGAALIVHIVIGGIAFAAYWAALGSRKGSPLHRGAGKICLAVLIFVILSVGPILFSRPGPFDPGFVVQMVYLTVCIGTVSMLAYTAIRFKREPERFRGRWFRILGPVMLLLGGVVLIAGLAKPDPVALTLSWVGLAFGTGMIAFARYRAPLHPRWWLGWHLNAVSALFNAVHGTVLYVLFRWAGLVPDGATVQAAFQVLTVVAALAMRVWFGQKYGAPLGFGPGRAMLRPGPS